MPVGVCIREITANSGDTAAVVAGGVTCIVGSNNSGKSQILRDIHSMLAGNAEGVALQHISLNVERATPDELTEWLDEHVGRIDTAPGQPVQYNPMLNGTQRQRDAVISGYTSYDHNPEQGLGAATPFFALLTTAGQLASIATQGLGMSGMAVGTNPVGKLYQDGGLEARLSALSDEAFSLPLTLDRLSADVRLRVGRVDLPIPPLNWPTREYAAAVSRLPSLDVQGDGMKSFLGVALLVLTTGLPILLVDEPEAFLHPGQARTLGRLLAREAKQQGLQILLGTHDRDLLLGLVDAPDSNVTVIRVSREGDSTHLHQLSSNEIRELWADPVLRYSNVLQGLFHRAVCVSEGDADCRFYGAVLDAAASNDRGLRARADDLLFVPSGGKNRVASLAAALTGLGVEAWAIVDFDVLRDRSTTTAIVSALGGTWTPENDEQYKAMARALNERQLWDSVKSQGLAAVPAGPPTVAAKSLLSDLAQSRCLVVPVGELEGFNRDIDLHGPAWVSTMLEREGHKTCFSARDFVTRLVSRAL